ncbi:ABC transporter permease [Paenibacillus puerhi]|uniref:ABC transporter permease n=1 Tax=Paenibacillus puerhi TaxID=2692622 RepID=UPI001F393BD0|nr:ABC transporter permease subunit [Paenibacillus puerhi]
MSTVIRTTAAASGTRSKAVLVRIWRFRLLYIMLIPAAVWVFAFDYMPIYGLGTAFLHYNYVEGIAGSEWAGLHYFRQLFESEMFRNALTNTIIINLYKMISGFVCPILLALALSEVKTAWYRKTLQTAVYLPRFVSWVVYGGLITILLSPETGIVNKLIVLFGGEAVYFLAEPHLFRGLLVITDAMKEMGWAAIVYIAAISGINPETYEAAIVDGASRMQRVIHITLPGIATTIIVLFILRIGFIMSAGIDQVLNLYNPMVYEAGDILDTYIYRMGIEQFNVSLATAADAVKGVVGLVLVLITNAAAKRINGDSGIF